MCWEKQGAVENAPGEVLLSMFQEKEAFKKNTWVVWEEENGYNVARESMQDPRLKIHSYLCVLKWGRGLLLLFPFGMKCF